MEKRDRQRAWLRNAGEEKADCGGWGGGAVGGAYDGCGFLSYVTFQVHEWVGFC